MAVEDWRFVSEDDSDNASITDSRAQSGSNALEFNEDAGKEKVLLERSIADSPSEGRVVFEGKHRNSWNGTVGIVFGYTDPQNWYGLHVVRGKLGVNSDTNRYVLLTQMSDGDYSRLDIEGVGSAPSPQNWQTYSLTFWQNNEKLMARVKINDDVFGADLTANVADESALAGGVGVCDHTDVIQNNDFNRAYSQRWWADDVEVYYDASN